MLVFFYHVTNNANEKLKTDFLFNAFSFGKAGVDIFFVLSGFIITYTNSNGLSNSHKLGTFLKKRFVRIFPVYWLVLSLLIVVQQLIPSFFRRRVGTDLGSLVSTYLLLPSHIPVNGLCVSWTLTFELFFYIIFSLGFIIPKLKWFFLSLFLLAMGILLFAYTQNDFGHAYAMMQEDNENKILKIFTSPLNIEFLLGVLAARILPIHSKSASIAILTIGALTFTVSGISINLDSTIATDDLTNVILFGLPSFCIIVGLVNLEQLIDIKIPKILLVLGDASYSLYLLHFPLVVASIKILSHFNLRHWPIIQLMLWAIVIIVCYVSLLFYRFIEKSAIKWLNPMKKNQFL